MPKEAAVFRISAICILLIFSISYSQASNQSGLISSIQVRDDGLHWIYLSGSREGRPACATNHVYWMIKDENSTYGKSQFSMILAAFLSKTPVTIIGNGTCSRWGDGEDIGTVQLQ